MLFNKMNNLGFCCTPLLIVQELLKSSALSSGHARLDFVFWKWIEEFGVEIWDSSRRSRGGATHSSVWSLSQGKRCSGLVLEQTRINSLLQGMMGWMFVCCEPRGGGMGVPRDVLGDLGGSKAWERLEGQENLKEEKGNGNKTGGRGGGGQWGLSSAILSSAKLLSLLLVESWSCG